MSIGWCKWTLLFACATVQTVFFYDSGNIPGSDVSKGEVIFDYLQPFPPKGVGYHRMVFIMYKQEEKLDFSKLKKNPWYAFFSIWCSKNYEQNLSTNLDERTFKTYDFYRERQEVITPAGIAFFQADWDESVRQFFHKTLCKCASNKFNCTIL